MPHSTDMTNRFGVAIAAAAFEAVGFAFREQATSDFGIDAIVEPRQGAVGTGQLVAVQIKAGSSYFKESTADGWWIRTDRRHAEYWLSHALPVVVALVDVDTRKVFWAAVSQVAVQPTEAGVRILIPTAQQVDATAVAALVALVKAPPGLMVTFDTRLHRFDAAAFDALIAEVLGPDTDVTIEERSNVDAEGPAFIRINGSNPDELIAVMEAFYARVWSSTVAAEDAGLRRAMTALETLFGPRLDAMRHNLAKIEASTDLLANDDVREAITDKAVEHVTAKRKKLFQTRFQRIADGLAKETPKKLIAAFIEEKAAEALGEVLGGVAETAVDETMDVLQDRLEVGDDGDAAAHASESPDALRTDGVVFPVWFATNRESGRDGVTFTNARASRTTLGRVLVHVPEAHRFGETGTGFWTRLLRFDWRDDRLRLQRVERRQREAFFCEIREATQAARDVGAPPQALVFLHGFNVSFEDAAIRTAQIGYDLRVRGATAFFSWPSLGRIESYAADEATIEASEHAISRFLVDFVANCGADKVHIVAHSMGNRGLLRALQRIATASGEGDGPRFGQIFLAAPDVDRDLFLNLVPHCSQRSDRTTLYASNGDRAVHLSAVLHSAPRAGYFEPYTVAPGVDTVAVPDFDIDQLGHSYFAQAEALLHDIHVLMRHGDGPEVRQRLTRTHHDGASFWRLGR